MNSRSTWNWIVVALVLFAFIFFFERHQRKPAPEPPKVFPQFDARSVTSVQVRHAGQREIRAEQTNEQWVLTEPISYPGQAAAIEGLLDRLSALPAAHYISARELRARNTKESDYGFDSPQVSLNVQEGEARTQILIGDLTAPGDQVFVQVVGVEGVGVVDAGLLNWIPQTADDWRDTALLDLRGKLFDKLTISRAGKIIELQHDPTNRIWTMTQPVPDRADHDRITTLLQQLQALRVVRFVPAETRAELESFGLRPPELELAFASGTNTLAVLQFGKPTTNDAAQVFARRVGLDAVVTVSRDVLAPWQTAVKEENGFRAKHLISNRGTVQQIEFRGETNEPAFVVRRTGSNSWNIPSEEFPVDAGLVNETIALLRSLPIVAFKDVVTDLPAYGLASPSRQIVLQVQQQGDAGATNQRTVHLLFGATQDDKMYVRRTDEGSIYSLNAADVQFLPTAAWQLRERRLWNFTEDDVARLTVRQDGKTRELIRSATNSWSFAPGSQGVINAFGVEETAHRLGGLAATAWVGRGDEKLPQFGFGTNNWSLTVDLKNGEKRSVEFGGVAENLYPFAATKLGGQTWIFLFPVSLYQYVSSYLTIPTNAP